MATQGKDATISEQVLVAVGSNIATDTVRPENVARLAADALASRGFSPLGVSRSYRTPAFPPGSGPDYVNAALLLPACGTPASLLDMLHEIERGFGREREVRWAPRGIDLDLVAWGARIEPDEETQRHWSALAPERQRLEAPEQLVLPHPRMQERAFVLVPLLDVAPEWRHPVTGQTIAEMVETLPAEEKAAILELPELGL